MSLMTLALTCSDLERAASLCNRREAFPSEWLLRHILADAQRALMRPRGFLKGIIQLPELLQDFT